MKYIKTTLFVLAVVLAANASAQPAVIPATVDVSAIGAATYTIPIEVVPGTNGLQPNLSVVYNSMSGLNVFGQKWGLQGISSITRVPQNRYYDGNIIPVGYDTTDRFALDGNRMLLLSGTSYQATNAVYCFEVEDFSRVNKVGTSNNFFFTQTLQDGTVVEYGRGVDAQLIVNSGKCLSWMASKITDPAGNYMKYYYQQVDGEIWIDHIDYTFLSDGTPAYATVCFEYETMTNPNDGYVNGQQIRQSKRLKNIIVRHQESQVRKYRFHYNATLQYDRLSSICLYGSNNELLSTTSVIWNNQPSQMVTDEVVSTLTGGYYVVAGNFNSDRIYDYVAVDKNSLNAYIHTGVAGESNWQMQSINYHFPNMSNQNELMFESMTAGDIDGDGVDELIYHRPSDGMWLSLKIDNSLNVTETPLFYSSASFVSLGDFDGDGVVEPVALENGNHLFSYHFEGMANPNTILPTPFYSYCPGDFDGDGKTDLLLLYQSNAHLYSYNNVTNLWEQKETYPLSDTNQYCLPGDFNGDGMSDILFLPTNSSQWLLAIRNGKNSWTLRPITDLIGTHLTSMPHEPVYPPVILDINGDGKSDIIQSQGEGTIKYLISKGCFDYNFFTYSIGNITQSTGQLIRKSYYSLGDFDGNGIVDILFSNPNGGGQMGSIKYFYKDGFPNYFVSQITDNAGKKIKLEYSTISLMPTRYFGAGMNWMPLPLVKNLIISNGLNGFDTTCFYYGDAQYDVNRHQFIGFAEFGTKNNSNVSETFFSRVPKGANATFAMLMPDSVVNYVLHGQINIGNNRYWSAKSHLIQPTDDILVSKTININSSKYRTTVSGNVSFLPYVSNSTNYDYLKNTKIVISTTLNTTHWRPSQLNKTWCFISNPSEPTSRLNTNYSYTSYTLTNGVSVVKPSRITTLQYNNSSSTLARRDTLSFSYSIYGYPQTKTQSDNSGLSTTETYTYNSYGLPTSIVTSQRGDNSPRSRMFTYDPTYRFVIRTTDHAGNVTQRTFDPATGHCLSETDINNLVTQYQYDGLGRMTFATFPDATTKTITYTNASGGLGNACCYTTVTENGKPETRTYYDYLGRKTHTYVAGQGYMDIVYNKLGQVIKQTLVPYTNTSTSTSSKKWETYKYDIFGRLVKDSSNYKKNTYSYSVGNSGHLYQESVVDKLGAESTKYYDAAGRVVRIEDNGGVVSYAYDRVSHSGKIYDRTSITTASGITTILTDSRGNRISLTDPDAGVTTSTFDAWGSLLSQTDGKGDITTITYDNQGRVASKTYSLNGSIDVYRYIYGTAAPTKGKVTRVHHNNAIYQLLNYDAVGRVSNVTKYIGGSPYTHTYTYDSNGQLYTTQYPSGFVLRHEYDDNRQLKYLKSHTTNTAIYTVDSRNTLGQPKRCWFGNNTGVEYTYDAWGLPTQVKYGYREIIWPGIDPLSNTTEGNEIQGGDIVVPITPGDEPIVPIVGPTYYVGSQYSTLQYSYNENGYVTRKKDTKTGQQEDYTYDILGRLTSVGINGTQSYSYSYEDNGNINKNSKVGGYDYVYDADKPHAVVEVIDDNGVISSSQCDVTYNSRNRPATISENGWSLELSYGSGLQREKSILKNGNSIVNTTYFISKDCELELSSSSSRYIDYIYADGRIVALHVYNITANTDSIYYIQTDLLGSWDRIVDGSKQVVQSSHFDPWGNRMSASDWTLAQDGRNFAFRRGFTGHEHYDRFGIINMNARLYDPVIGRFFSPDPQVQNPFSTQGFNRYSYCGNNPVMYTDPNGEFFIIDSWILGFIHGFFSTGNNRWEAAWNTANRIASNDLKLWGGLFITDPNKSFFGQVWEIVSRFTWQAPQTLAGFTLSQFANASEWIGFTNGGIQSIDYLYGATVVTYNLGGWGAVTLGSYINGDNNLKADPNNYLFQHEYGHYIQSQNFGIVYLSRYGIPSGLNCMGHKNHNYHPAEQDANIRAFKYFNKYIDNYTGWKCGVNPIGGYDNSLPYDDSQNQAVLNNGLLRPAWYDYILPGWFAITGIINWLSLENYEEH